MNISQHSFVPLGFILGKYYYDTGQLVDASIAGTTVATSCDNANSMLICGFSGYVNNGGNI